MPNRVLSVDLKDLMEIYFKSECVLYEYKGLNCGKIDNVKKELLISKTSKILIIPLKGFLRIVI